MHTYEWVYVCYCSSYRMGTTEERIDRPYELINEKTFSTCFVKGRYTAKELFWFLRNMWLSMQYSFSNNVYYDIFNAYKKAYCVPKPFSDPRPCSSYTRAKSSCYCYYYLYKHFFFHFRFSSSLFRDPVPSIQIIFV